LGQCGGQPAGRSPTTESSRVDKPATTLTLDNVVVTGGAITDNGTVKVDKRAPR